VGAYVVDDFNANACNANADAVDAPAAVVDVGVPGLFLVVDAAAAAKAETH